jgi:hypothetical protein
LTKEVREGFWQDEEGNWHPERRSGKDRRKESGGDYPHAERRRFFRRKADRELYERDHKQMISDALNEFAKEHGGRL